MRPGISNAAPGADGGGRDWGELGASCSACSSAAVFELNLPPASQNHNSRYANKKRLRPLFAGICSTLRTNIGNADDPFEPIW
jgi:hypothetical protein